MIQQANKRLRGFGPYIPRGGARQLIENSQSILREYRQASILPISLRQLFYRLVVLFEYRKTEKDYSRLSHLTPNEECDHDE